MTTTTTEDTLGDDNLYSYYYNTEPGGSRIKIRFQTGYMPLFKQNNYLYFNRRNKTHEI